MASQEVLPIEEEDNLPEEYDEEWGCRNCGWTYTSPIPVSQVSHLCPDGRKRKLELK